MTNKIFITVCAALLLSAMIMFIAAVPSDAHDNAALTSGEVKSSEEAPVTYTVKSYGNRIGIFAGSESEPIKTIGIDPKSLPDEARKLLDDGITVNGRDELLLLIEDYIS